MHRSPDPATLLPGRRQSIPVVAGVLVGLASTLPESFPAQGLFEVLVIAQASLLAIVVSVSMMSMQVSTNRFAPQLAQIYRERGFNAIIARFGLSILLDLSLFALPGAILTRLPVRAGVVALAVGVASWAFVSLLQIEERLLVFLNPDPVLSSLVESVSLERYLEFAVTHREDGRVSRNPILEIHQVAQTSLEQRDNYSALRAVDALEEATERLLADYAALPASRKQETAESLHKLFDYWNRIADLAVEKGADDTLHAVVEAESAIGRQAIELDIPEAATGAADAVFHFCAVTLANNRLESQYHATLGDLLSASLEHDSVHVARRTVTDLARLSRLVDRRDDDLLVAADERITPHEEFFEHWASLVGGRRSRLETEDGRLLYEHFEHQYRMMRDEAVEDGRIDRFARTATDGFLTVGLAAADSDLGWAVSRTTEHLLALAALADRSPEATAGAIGRIATGGGREGVVDAIVRLQNGSAESGDPGDRGTGRIHDPIAETTESGSEAGGGRHTRSGLASSEFAPYVGALESSLDVPTATRGGDPP